MPRGFQLFLIVKEPLCPEKPPLQTFCAFKVFLVQKTYSFANLRGWAQMKTNEAKTATTATKEIRDSYADLQRSVVNTVREAKGSQQQLWREGKKPTLIKIGLALIAFPDPTVSDVVGSFLVAAGTVQEGIRRRSLYMEDVPKTLQSLLKDLRSTKNLL